MAKAQQHPRRIIVLVEGDTERGDARRATLPVFFRKWLDRKWDELRLPQDKRVGITAINSKGVGKYLDDLADKVVRLLDQGQANFVIGLLDLYGLPSAQIDLSKCNTVQEKVKVARNFITGLVPQSHRGRFRQHFAIHEVEAWLLAYPTEWPAEVRDQIMKRKPEEVNFKEPPAKFLKRILGGRYMKTVYAKNLFPKVDPQVAIDKCPFLKRLMEDLLEVAKRLL